MTNSNLTPFAQGVKAACLAILDNRLRRKAKLVELDAPDILIRYEDHLLAEVTALLDTLSALEEGVNHE